MDSDAGGSPLSCPLMPAPDTPHHWLRRPASPSADVMSDVEDVKFVINYDYPNSSEDYIHRIGRTARSHNTGTAYTFFTPGNLRQARELIRVLEEARQAINPKLLQLVDTGRGGGGGGGGRPRFRGSSNSNNPNLMYQDECERRMRSAAGGSTSKDCHGSSSYSRDGREGSSREGERSSSSYRDRSSTDGGRSSSSRTNSYNQYKTSNSSSSRGVSRSGSGGAGQAPPSSGPQPLMAQQFNPPQPMMGLMGHSPFQFAPLQQPPSSGRK
ncbi:hypothetical protein Q5P01_017683 [Channa striata]|uniref:Helicase C-terminal domain-containing protein n=1 Tax=Channa striata TaxID=64152 RepID=A0AA88SBW7_CHASR|nr:hypothetical protein Q5P01_017683 [Channa striata]